MTTEFEDDLREALSGLEEARRDFDAIVGGLKDSDLSRGRRGGWDICAVIEHVVNSEWHYAGLARTLRAAAEGNGIAPPVSTSSVSEARDALTASRAALLLSVDGVSEDDFYRLGGGGQEYSVLSVLQNVGQHDIEHGAQIAHLAATAPNTE